MSVLYQSPALDNKEIMALYGDNDDQFFRDEECNSEDFEVDSESSEEGRGGGRAVRSSSLCLQIYGLQRDTHVRFSNQHYYRRLEELKDTHLRNMAELERMYISEGRGWRQEEEREEEEEEGEEEEEEVRGRSGGRSREAKQSLSAPARTLQRINSQEELDFHDSSSASDQSELCSEDSMAELDDGRGRMFGRGILVIQDKVMDQKRFRFQPVKPRGGLSPQPGVKGRPCSKVTVPRPFQMMVREEDRKRLRVRTRSQMELENALLKRELDELRECQKQFRASPAPAHIRLPLYDIISRRSPQRPTHRNNNNNNKSNNRASAAGSPLPFNFLERERKKREAKIVAELGNLRQGAGPQAFKARPLPSAVYGTKHRTRTSKTRSSQSPCAGPKQRETCAGAGDLTFDPQPQSDAPCEKGLIPKPGKKQIEVSIEMVKGEWETTNPAQGE